ncbi:YidC/Oxa1 family membrane protein insertase [Cruoricaptor ignavus]|uniref:Membrane protein insertase YidC n=1 Tax=Cruoricaptor ignavus TaxID=1118202 RepID=A0A1M6H807_9FLAO|nr:membrane protein insertase YidC [Cruoricaptor ignavus]SHJ18310.1 YidC/Oxa1 family membrane protein insertase [Cruoricaptor ignavus]
MQEKNGLDRSQLINFMIFSLLLMGCMFYFTKRQADREMERQQQAAKTEQVQSAVKPAESLNHNPDAQPAQIQTLKLENNELNLELSTLGGQISQVELKQYKAYNHKTDKADLPLYLFAKNNSSYGFEFKDKTGKSISTKNLIFSPQVSGNSVTMTANVNGGILQFVYTLLPNYTVDFKVKSQGLSQITTDSKANFLWNFSNRNLEKGRNQEQTHSEFVYAFNNYKSYDYDGRTTMDESGETLNWLGIKQQFFAPVIEANGGFTQSKGEQVSLDSAEFLKKFDFGAQVQMNGGELNQDFKWYFLPLDLPLLKSYDKNFEEILPLGWSFIGTLNRGVFIPMYNFISSWGLTAGWVIFVMTIIVKLVLSPIMFKQHKLGAMMRVIKPELDEVNEKYKDADPLKKQQAMMDVYRKAGVNQMAGCLPALLQIPLFYALFRFFPNMIDLRGKSFWFAKDLTAYDDLIKFGFNIPLLGDHLSIFAVACTAVVLLYTMMTSGQMQQPQQEGMPNMKVLMYIFPITFLFFLNSAASGLSWYYFVSNAINIVIILVIKHFILDEKKIHAQIQANKAQPKKEGKFQKRMREMMEQAQEQQRLQQEQLKKQQKRK